MFKISYVIISIITLCLYAYLYKRVMRDFGDVFITKPEEGQEVRAVSLRTKLVSNILRVLPILLCLMPIANFLVLANELILLTVLVRRS